jgi:hypothetical protein
VGTWLGINYSFPMKAVVEQRHHLNSKGEENNVAMKGEFYTFLASQWMN